jgi:hypothetical protein
MFDPMLSFQRLSTPEGVLEAPPQP